MTNTEKKISEMIEQAEVVADPLEKLVEKAKTDPGAPFEPEVLASLADLQERDGAEFQRLRAKLKNIGVPVGKLDKAIAGHGGGCERRVNAADILLELVDESDLFHAPDGRTYADVCIDGERETLEISESGFGKFLHHRYFQETGSAPTPEAMKSVLRQAEAKARYEGPEHEVYVRVAPHSERVYVDLGGPGGQAIEIGPSGSKIIKNPPVRFRRPSGMRRLPVPVHGADVAELRRFLNLRSESDFVLVAHWLIHSLFPARSYPVLVLGGEQGSAKSVTSRILRALVDPNSVPIRALPANERDLMIAATNGHVLAFDNVSTLPPWLSDALCRLSTGGGFATRRNYTDRDEELFNAACPVILNGIASVVTRPDLAERALFIMLEPIPEDQRLPEEQLWAEFEKEGPRILGALLDAISEGLRRLPDIQPSRLPRMADFARMAMARETAFWEAGTFEKAYWDNMDEAVQAGVEADPVATALCALVTRTMRTMRTLNLQDPLWEGITMDLLDELNSVMDQEGGYRGPDWPKTPHALSNRLRRSAPLLRKRGIEIRRGEREGHNRDRIIYIMITSAYEASDRDQMEDQEVHPESEVYHEQEDVESTVPEDTVDLEDVCISLWRYAGSSSASSASSAFRDAGRHGPEAAETADRRNGEQATETALEVETPKPPDGAGNGSAPSAPKDVLPEEDEVYDAED